MLHKYILTLGLLFSVGSCLSQTNLAYTEQEEKEAVQKVVEVMKGLKLKPFQRFALNTSSFNLRILVDTFGNTALDSIYGLRDTAIIQRLKDGINNELKMSPFIVEGEKIPYIFFFTNSHGSSRNAPNTKSNDGYTPNPQRKPVLDGITGTLGFGGNLPLGNASHYSSMGLGLEANIHQW